MTAPELPAAGTEVQCRMLVAGERCTLRGRIAWVRPPAAHGGREATPGAGIRFVNVTARDAQLLARLVEPNDNDRQMVDVWFEGLRAPIRSHASITDDSLSISTRLPFLRLNSPVRVSFVRRGVEEMRSGTLEAVTLQPSVDDGIPRLRLTVSTPAPDKAYGTIEVSDALPLGAEESPRTDEPRTVIDPAVAELLSPVDAETLAAPIRDFRPDLDRTPTFHATQEPITPAPPIPQPTPAPRIVELTRPRSSRRFWVGAVAAAIAAVGYYVARPSFAPTQRRPTVSTVPVRDVQTVVPSSRATAPAPTPEPAPPIETPPESPPADAPGATAEAPAKAPPARAVAEPFAITRMGDATSMVIPVVGSLKGMQSYRLAEPPGLTILLPHSRPRAAAGDHPVSGGFKRLIVTRKGAGSQVRIYFPARQNADVVAESAAVRVTLKGKALRKR